MKTQAQVRDSFWDSYPEYQREKRSRKRQNDYRTDIRVASVLRVLTSVSTWLSTHYIRGGLAAWIRLDTWQ